MAYLSNSTNLTKFLDEPDFDYGTLSDYDQNSLVFSSSVSGNDFNITTVDGYFTTGENYQAKANNSFYDATFFVNSIKEYDCSQAVNPF